MTQNPFDALGGGFDMNALLQQAQQMQQQLEEAQANLAKQTVDGTDPDDLSDLSDLIVAAYRDARAKSEALAGDQLGPLTDGLGGGAGGGTGFPGLG